MTDLKIIVDSMPKKAFNEVAKTACDTFRKVIYPITAITEGVGRLLEHKLETKLDVQKIIAVKCFQEAAEKVEKSSKKQSSTVVIKPIVLYEALDNTDSQTDPTIRGLWANLLATELTEGSVHPEIAKMLGKITTEDALLLAKIAEKEEGHFSIRLIKVLATITVPIWFKAKATFNHLHLKNLGLIKEIENEWFLSVTGREFMRCVSDPE